jgi:hypothetical protein
MTSSIAGDSSSRGAVLAERQGCSGARGLEHHEFVRDPAAIGVDQDHIAGRERTKREVEAVFGFVDMHDVRAARDAEAMGRTPEQPDDDDQRGAGQQGQGHAEEGGEE